MAAASRSARNASNPDRRNVTFRVSAGDAADHLGLGQQLVGDGDGGGHASPGVTGTLPATWTPGTIPPRIIAIPAQSGAHS